MNNFVVFYISVGCELNSLFYKNWVPYVLGLMLLEWHLYYKFETNNQFSKKKFQTIVKENRFEHSESIFYQLNIGTKSVNILSLEINENFNKRKIIIKLKE